MFCDACGTRNRDGAAFCRECGGKLVGGDEGPTLARPASEQTSPLVVPRGTSPLPATSPADATLATPPPEPASQLDGVRRALAGKLEVIRLLGRGGMGAVYLARERALDRVVAVKILPPELAAELATVDRFLQEARLSARLRHPHIVAIHTVGEAGGLFHFTMDYVDGETLGAFVRRRRKEGTLTAAETGSLFRDLASAVGHAHGHGVVHRDLKPNNVMVEAGGRLFVMDFGLAKVLGQSGSTGSGSLVGTPQYMSPEQIDGRPATPRSDIYALGLIYYFLLTAEDLVQGDTVSEVFARHLQAAFRPRIAADPRLPSRAIPLLLSMLEKDPARRPVSIELILGSFDSGEPPGPRVPLAPRSPVPPPAPDGPVSPVPTATPGGVPYRKQAREKMKGLIEKLQRKPEG